MIYALAEVGCREYVKIGTTRGQPNNLEAVLSRMRALQAGNHRTLHCIATAHGGGKEERALHERFARHRVRGEWFERIGMVDDWCIANAVVAVRSDVRRDGRLSPDAVSGELRALVASAKRLPSSRPDGVSPYAFAAGAVLASVRR